jgi:hypothetical protein
VAVTTEVLYSVLKGMEARESSECLVETLPNEIYAAIIM